MPNATTRANAKASPKTNPDPDAAIFAIVKQLASVQSRYDAACKVFDEAEERYKTIETPRELFKTEEDARLRLFIMGAAGESYRPLEIEAIGSILRSFQDYSDRDCYTASRRCETILASWSTWTARKHAEGARSGYDAASRAQGIALNELSTVLEQLMVTPAVTVDGVLAKAHALGRSAYVENLTEIIKERINTYGAFDREAMALSLFADLISKQQARA